MDDGSATLDDRRHDVARAILERRSWRIFMEDPVTADALSAVTAAAEAAPSVRGGSACWMLLVSEPEAVRDLTRVIGGGLLGKVNLWLRSAPPPAWAVLIGDADRGVTDGPHHLYNVDVAVTGELVALAAARAGLGSCWMSAIDMKGIARHLDLPDSARVPAVIALGEAGLRRKGALFAAGWNRFTRIKISGRRKPMERLCSLERFGSGESLGETDLATLADDGRSLGQVAQAMGPSARFGGESPTDPQLGLLLESMRLAPSADNAQTWRFVVLRGREQTVPVLESAGVPMPAGDAPGAVVALFAAPFLVKGVHKEQPFALIDHPIALTHVALVADVLGLSWNVTFSFDRAAVRTMLGAPENHPPTALLMLDCVGERSVEPHPDWVQLHR